MDFAFENASPIRFLLTFWLSRLLLPAARKILLFREGSGIPFWFPIAVPFAVSIVS